MSSAKLLAALGTRARTEGANAGLWPGLTIYRFTRPTRPRWDEIGALSIGIIALHDQTSHVVIGGHEHFDRRILRASVEQPVLCFVLEIDPQLVRAVSASMRGFAVAIGGPEDDGQGCAVSRVDDDLRTTVVRFLDSLSASCDRRVLAPLHLQELVYRVLQGEQRQRLVQLAAHQAMANPVAAALDYISEHLAEPLTVDALAAQVYLGPSAFSRVFREVTGRSPYQYVKETRLDRARQLFDQGRRGVADVARSVGYTSVSHFIKEFRSRVGATPGDYAEAQTFRGRVAS
jgi:AraC-like DNA-binding protein